MRVLVLGAYGLIGLPISKALAAAGHQVTGLARSQRLGRSHLPDADWIEADIAGLTHAGDWTAHLTGVDAVVNASGALQDGAKDRIVALQSDAIRALIAACESHDVRRFVQISAPGATPDSDTLFYSSKGEADAALKDSALDWTIFRPGVVIGPSAYGGSGLLRMLAAFPVVQPVVMADAQIQTVAIDDVVAAVAAAIEGEHIAADFDLVEEMPRSLEETVGLVRTWLGFEPARAILRLPRWLGYGVAKFADCAGWFGWRSPLRTSALKVLEAGVTGSGTSGVPLKTLPETLAGLPSSLQERIYARAMLVFPVLVAVLSLFWLASGTIGIWQSEAAVAVLGDSLPPGAAWSVVIGGGVVDIAIGAALMFRRWLRLACFAAIAVSSGYLIGGTILTPYLWADPLGVFVKVLPGIGLALIVASLAEGR